MLVVHHHVLERRHLLEHHGNFRALVLPHDVLLHAGAELLRLADVYDPPDASFQRDARKRRHAFSAVLSETGDFFVE